MRHSRRTLLKSLAAASLLPLTSIPFAHASLPKMKITRIRGFAPPNPNPLFNQSNTVVTIETDAGITGIYSQLCEKTRQDAFVMMMEHAAEHGGNAVIMARYDANELMQGVTEVLAYGTAVVVEKL